MSRRPIIAITGPDRGGFPAWLFTSWAVRFAGGNPVRVTPRRGRPAAVDGLIIGGGADVCPTRYGDVAPPSVDAPRKRKARSAVDHVLARLIYAVRRVFGLKPANAIRHDHARDDLELAMIAAAERERIPVLGICRGAQLLNVHAGGSLHRDLSSFYLEHPNPWTVFPRKRVEVDVDSRLGDALGTLAGDVNSMHRQAIDRLGAALRAVARDRSGVVQAIEHPGRRFWIGVQWHPEYLPQVPEQRRLLRQVVGAAAQSLPGPTRAAVDDGLRGSAGVG